jgi:hypothetical protein
MSVGQEIENAVSKLSTADLSIFREWFEQFDAEAWDKQFAEDVTAGRLDVLADEALCGIVVKAAATICEAPRKPKVLVVLSSASA